MKIGIITHWKDNDNYGAALQSYALQRYLRNLGHDAFVIRFIPKVEHHSLPQRIINFIKKPSLLKSYIKLKVKPASVNEWDKLRDFKSFREKYIAYSPVIYHGLDELKSNAPEADMYITGSDQVWHGSLNQRENRAFFLDFGGENTKRISYAASFGRNYFPCENELLFKNLLQRFSGVSMREESGVRLLKERGISAVRSLDSTLLLEGEQYNDIMDERRYKEKFVFFYTVNVGSPDELYWDQIKRYFNQKGLLCVVTTGSGYKQASEMFDGAIYDYATVPGWLSNIYNSEVVVTASFHGIAFSLKLKKNFIYMPLKGRHSAGNDRIIDLIKSVGLLDRMANNWDDVVKLIETKIDYSQLEKEMYDSILLQSKNFLTENIKNLIE
jgi:hypothetical protein